MPYKDPAKRKAANRAAYKKWAEANPDKVKEAQSTYRAKGSRRNARKPWTMQEEVQLMNHEGTDAELSIKIGRSVNAITVRRNRIKNRF